jgi:urocanate hydratase
MSPSLKATSSVVVDDNDPALMYSPSNWTSYTDDGMNEVGDWGPPYQQTLHGISGDGSVSFSFNGA